MLETETGLLPLTVSDVKQYVYCPRVVYYTYHLSIRRPVTFKMEEGKREHEHAEELEQRRSLQAYGLKEGTRHFNVFLRSDRLGLSGRLDLVIERPHEAIPVDFKNTSGPAPLNHKYQLAAYALLIEERWRKPVRRGFIYFVPDKRAQELLLTATIRRFSLLLLDRARRTVLADGLPSPTRHRGRCYECEFRLFCNDIW